MVIVSRGDVVLCDFNPIAPLSVRMAPLSMRIAPLSGRIAPLSGRIAPLSVRIAPLSVRIAPLSGRGVGERVTQDFATFPPFPVLPLEEEE